MRTMDGMEIETTCRPDVREPLWDRQRLALPHQQPDKARRVQRMFDGIAPTYERVNTWASGGRDRYWRQEMVRVAGVGERDVLLDIACGTGDVLRTFASAGVSPARLMGVDFSEGMLRAGIGRLPARAAICRADALRLPLPDGAVSLVTCAFGIRNFQHLPTAFAEMYRVLAPGGRAVILEFRLPANRIIRRAYLLYFRRVLPWLGSAISRDRSGAYRYLPSSVISFPSSRHVCEQLRQAGFAKAEARSLSWGIVEIIRADK